MAKRFTDTDKWKRSWFRSLSPAYKAFWFYLFDNCDQAGVWEVDLDAASFYIGEKLRKEEVLNKLGKQVIEFDGGERWLILGFIEFQYGCPFEKLNPQNNAHLSAIRIIEKYDIKNILSALFKGSGRAEYAPKEKEKESDIEKEVEFQEGVSGGGISNDKLFERGLSEYGGPSLDEVTIYFDSIGYPNEQARAFWEWNEGNGWINNRGAPLKVWKSRVDGWIKNSEIKANKGGTENVRISSNFTQRNSSWENDARGRSNFIHTATIPATAPKFGTPVNSKADKTQMDAKKIC